MTRLMVAVAVCLAAAACGGADPTGDIDAGPGIADGAVGPDAPTVDPSAPLFDPTHVVEIEIDMPAADWDALRYQTRSLIDILRGDCLAQPFPSPFTWFSGTVTIDGTAFSNVGVRKKGFLGSLDDQKPSLKIKFDEYVPGQEYLGLVRLTLNNARQDPSLIRQCLTYPIFTAAGVPSPRCNFAHVVVNGADLGVFANVESVDKRFLARHFPDNEGNLYEGTLSDFRPDFVNTFDPKTNETTTGDRGDLLPLVDVLESSSNAALMGDLAPILDVQDFTTFWATEVLTGHWDGYANNTNNYFVYNDPATGLLEFMPWGIDGVMQPGHNFGPGGAQPPPVAVAAEGMLTRRLYLNATTRSIYLARLRTLLDDVWNEVALEAEIDRMTAMLDPYISAADGIAWNLAVEDVRAFVSGRREELTVALDAGTPNWEFALRNPPCFVQLGTFDATFTTTWDTLASMNPFAEGSGTMDLVMGGTPVPVNPITAMSGLDPNAPPGEPPHVIIQMIGVKGDNTLAIAVIQLWPWRYETGVPIPIDLLNGIGVMYDYEPATGTATMVGLLLGELTLTANGSTAGAPVAGSFTGEVDTFPFN